MIRWLAGLLGAGCIAVVLMVVGTSAAQATGPNVSVTSVTVSRDASTGKFTFSISATADTYWGTTCTSSYCHLEIDVRHPNGSVERIGTQPASTGSGAVTTKTYSGSTLITPVTDVRARLIGSGGEVAGSWVPVTDAYPSTKPSLSGITVSRVSSNGLLSWTATATASYFNLPDGPCPSGSCYLVLQSRDQSGSTQVLQTISGLSAYTTFPRNFSLSGQAGSLKITDLRVAVYGSGGYSYGDWMSVADTYPQAVATMTINKLHQNSDGTLTWNITASASNYWLPDGVCRQFSTCYIEVVTKDANGAVWSFLGQGQQNVNNQSYPYTRVFSGTTSVPYTGDVGPIEVTVHGPYGTIHSGWVTPQVLSALETAGGGNPAAKTCQCTHADPVNTATGEFYLPKMDLPVSGVGPLVGVSRTYSSVLRGVPGAFGYGWSTDFGSRIVVDVAGSPPVEVHIEQENGSRVTFRLASSGAYVTDPWIVATLERDAGTGAWTYTRNHRETFEYDSSGLLASRSDLHGNEISYAYSGGHVVTISGSGGREVELTWASGRVTKAEDAAGRITTYSYDSNGNLTQVVDASGATWAHSYDSSHRMLTLTSPEGGVTTNQYDSSSRVVSQTDPVGRVTTFSYSGNITTTVLPGGSTTVEEYNQSNIIRVVQASGTATEAITTYQYNAAGDLISVTDPLGNITTTTFDGDGNPLTTTDPLDRTTTRTFDALGNVTSVEDPLGRLTVMTYNSDGDLTSLTSPGGHEQTWDVNPDGTIDSHTDARNQTTSYTYDGAGRPVCSTDADGRETCVSYDSRGFVTSSTDGAGADTEYTYDDLGRTLTVSDPLDAVTTTVYDSNGNALTIEDPNGNVTTHTYDDADQLVSSEVPTGGTTFYTYAPRGQVATVTNPNDDVVTSTYDALGRLATVTDGEARTTTYGYDLIGRLLTTTLPSSAVTANTYDDAGQLVATTNALGKITTFAYDDAGQLTSVTDPLNRTTSTSYTEDGLVDTVTYPDASTEIHTYNATGQETSFTNADGAVSTYAYTDAGLLDSKEEPGGLETSYTYDQAARLLGVTTPDGHTSTRSYDAAGHLTGIDYQGTADDVEFTYDDNGRRLTMDDATGLTTYTYTDDGQLESVENGNGKTLAYEYDEAGQLATITYPGGHDVDYTYNGAGQMASVTGWATGTTSYTYSDDGYLETRSDPNGVTETRNYDTAGELEGIVDATALATIVNYGYEYDDAGQLTSTTMTDALHAATSQTWGYDSLGQLTTTSSPAGAYAATPAGLVTANPAGDALSYNVAGQLTKVVNSGTGVETSYGYDDNGARTSTTIDPPVGATTSTTFGYTEAGSLETVTSGLNNLSYTTDGDGLRQSRTLDSSTRQFLWDPNSAIALLLDDDEHTYIYGAGITPIAQIDGTGDAEYLYGDNIGSIRAVADDAGALSLTIDYDAFGSATASSGTSSIAVGYAASWHDSVTGLLYLRARDYDPATTQFLSVDPLVSTTRSGYGYVGNNPLTHTDPTGLCTDAGIEWGCIDPWVASAADPVSPEITEIKLWVAGLRPGAVTYDLSTPLVRDLRTTANMTTAFSQLEADARAAIAAGQSPVGLSVSASYTAGEALLWSRPSNSLPSAPRINPILLRDLSTLANMAIGGNPSTHDRIGATIGSYTMTISVAGYSAECRQVTYNFDGRNPMTIGSAISPVGALDPYINVAGSVILGTMGSRAYHPVIQTFRWRETHAL